MTWHNALAMGAAVLAAVPVVSCETFSAFADDVSILPSWEQWRSLYDYNLTDPTVLYLYTDDVIAPYWRYYASAVMAVVEGVYINGNFEITPGDFSGMSGYYLVDGSQRFGSVYASGVSTVSGSMSEPSAPVALVALQDGTLSLRLAPDSGSSAVDYTIRKTLLTGGFTGLSIMYGRVSGRLWSNVTFEGTGIFDTYSYGATTAYDDTCYIRCNPAVEPVEFTTTTDYLAWNSSGGRVLLGRSLYFSSLPTSDAYPTITADNALDYVENVLNPYMEENAPDSAPYLYDPNATPPEPSTYPVQETWASNAEWPEGNLLPTIPAASYTVDIPEIMTEGAAFWWRCLGVLFDGLGITAVVVGLLALGIVLYFVLR